MKNRIKKEEKYLFSFNMITLFSRSSAVFTIDLNKDGRYKDDVKTARIMRTLPSCEGDIIWSKSLQ